METTSDARTGDDHLMRALDEDFLTVAEAATLLRVAPSTIRRWSREGDLPAYRLGRRRVALRRLDLSQLIKPVRTDETHGRDAGDNDDLERFKRRNRTPEEIERSLAALERAQQNRREVVAQRGGEPLLDSVEIIHRMRDERDRQLMEALGWDDPR